MMRFLDHLKVKWKSFQERFGPKFKKWVNSHKEETRTPSKFNNGRGGFVGMDTQKELKDFQSKTQPTKPQASAEDLSKVLEDVLDRPSSPDQGLYSGKKK